MGGFFAVAGAKLAWLGGSPYYLVAGVAMVAGGALIGRGDRRGRMLFLLVWVATVAWALWEVGTEPLWLMPRVLAPAVPLVLVYLRHCSAHAATRPPDAWSPASRSRCSP